MKSTFMKLRTVAASLLLMLSATTVRASAADVGAPVPIYTEAELIKLIEQNKHL
ncbi:flagellar protein MotX, partial [Vibrio sp. 1866]|nr:flagellar protein MotX [Vibrio sp. 1866]